MKKPPTPVRLPVLFAAGLLGWLAVRAHAGVASAAPRRFLFLDPALLSEANGAALTLNPAAPRETASYLTGWPDQPESFVAAEELTIPGHPATPPSHWSGCGTRRPPFPTERQRLKLPLL